MDRRERLSYLGPLRACPGFHEIFAVIADGPRVNDFGARPQVRIHAERIAGGVLDLDLDLASVGLNFGTRCKAEPVRINSAASAESVWQA
jgi:hypothetical protein